MPKHVAYRIHAALERVLPERRLFLKSDSDTRFIRLRPGTQAIAIAGAAVFVAWTFVATAILMIDALAAGSSREQTLRTQTLFEQRLEALSADRDARADEAVRAQDRFNTALAQVSAMQARLLASEDRRRELETGIEVIQATLRRTIRERDAARAQNASEVMASAGVGRSEADIGADTTATLAFLTAALTETANERDLMEGAAHQAVAKVDEVKAEKAALMARNDEIFTTLEEAVSVSMEPLDKMFRAAGLSPDDLISQVRRGYSGTGGPVGPLSLSTSGVVSPDEGRANALLDRFDEMNVYRLAAFKTPFAMPVFDRFRYTSGFGVRRDPKGWGNRMHEGIDMAGAHGTDIHATADGVVSFAGWQSGYGRLVTIRHDFGLETRFGHLSGITVEVGQRVSRGDKIGDMGSTGRSTGTHLHYEIRVDGTPVNPMTFIKAATNVF